MPDLTPTLGAATISASAYAHSILIGVGTELPIRPEIASPASTLEFLKRCFRFVSLEWPHAVREAVPDAGFEGQFRDSCVRQMPGWLIAPPREMRLGAWLDTLSGTSHEVDIVAKIEGTTAAAELKNLGGGPGKNDVVIFYAKILDYLLANPDLAYDDICLAFVSGTTFDCKALAACLSLGIHPVSSDIRPLPVLVNNAKAMQVELDLGLQVAPQALARFEDFCANLNRMAFALRETWLNDRCRYVFSDNGLLLRAAEPIDAYDLAAELRQANSDCIAIYRAFQRAQGAE